MGYVVRGRVQGVGFRWFARSAGNRLGISGHVRNLADGSVEVHARGSRQALADFEAALRRGPSGSRVEGIEAVAADPRTPDEGFEMERW
jgi:acylphosphatase